MRRRREELRAYIEGMEHGLQGISLDWEGASKRFIRSYEVGVRRGKAWRAHVKADRFGAPDGGDPDGE